MRIIPDLNCTVSHQIKTTNYHSSVLSNLTHKRGHESAIGAIMILYD